jgi:hypothetical protein
MDDVVALKASTEDGSYVFFMTFGRIQANVDPAPLEALVLRHSRSFETGSPVVSVEVCKSLGEAAHAPLFFEAILYFARQPMPSSRSDFFAWKRHIAKRMEDGLEIYSLGLSRS